MKERNESQELLARYSIVMLRYAKESDDWEYSHKEADRVLCALLMELGYEDVIEEYHKIRKWYS